MKAKILNNGVVIVPIFEQRQEVGQIHACNNESTIRCSKKCMYHSELITGHSWRCELFSVDMSSHCNVNAMPEVCSECYSKIVEEM